jgi:hypothetical protein
MVRDSKKSGLVRSGNRQISPSGRNPGESHYPKINMSQPTSPFFEQSPASTPAKMQ